MLRVIVGVARRVAVAGSVSSNITPSAVRTCSVYSSQFQKLSLCPVRTDFPVFQPLLSRLIQPAVPCLLQPQIRTLTKFSIRKGKRKTVKAVKKRFFRLAWGGWIRTRAGRFKHLWRKSQDLKARYRQHVFCNATQNTLLDKMVTKFWRRRKYYVDDPYEPYHSREEFSFTRRKPLPPPPK